MSGEGGVAGAMWATASRGRVTGGEGRTLGIRINEAEGMRIMRGMRSLARAAGMGSRMVGMRTGADLGTVRRAISEFVGVVAELLAGSGW